MARLAFLIPDMRGGGAERVALTLIEEFLERGHEVDLVLMQAKGELLELLPPAVRIVDLNADRMRHAILPLVRYLRARSPIALQAFMWPLTVDAVIAEILARTGTRIVTTDHGILSQQYGTSAWDSVALRLTSRVLYPRADARVAASSQIADDLASLSGMRRDRFEVMYNPIATPPDPIGNIERVNSLWRGPGARILSVGTLKEVKNHRLLIRTFADFARTREAQLMIVGDGPLRTNLENDARNLGISDRIALPGFQADPWPFYASADLFVLPSESEGFGNVLVEAMAVGLPVVSTDSGGPREVLAGGRFGHLVPVGDAVALCRAMAKVLDEPIDRDRLKARAREFCPKVAADRYLSLLLGKQPLSAAFPVP